MRKLIYTEQSEIFFGTVRQNGRLFRMCFVIFEREGKLRGKIISCEPVGVLSDFSALRKERYLPGTMYKQSAPESAVRFQEIVSPFSVLEFLTSIQIRAPSYNT